MALTKPQVRKLRADIEAVFKANNIPGFKIEMGNATYSQTDVNFKLVATQTGAKSTKEVKVTKQINDLPRFARAAGIDPNKVGAKGEKLVEYHVRKPKYPFIYETARGRRMKCTKDQAQRIFG